MPFLGSFSSILLHHQPNYVNQYLTKTLSETVTVSEAAFTRLKAAIRALAAQTVTIGDSLASIRGKVRALSQTVTIGESIARVVAKIRALAAQTITVSDGVVNISGKVRALAAQTVTISDAVDRVVTPASGANIVKTITETIIVSESRDRLKAVWRLQPP
jgi:type IV secretory pathway protease TraF